jgi:hypothetical protein
MEPRAPLEAVECRPGGEAQAGAAEETVGAAEAPRTSAASSFCSWTRSNPGRCLPPGVARLSIRGRRACCEREPARDVGACPRAESRRAARACAQPSCRRAVRRDGPSAADVAPPFRGTATSGPAPARRPSRCDDGSDRGRAERRERRSIGRPRTGRSPRRRRRVQGVPGRPATEPCLESLPPMRRRDSPFVVLRKTDQRSFGNHPVGYSRFAR